MVIYMTTNLINGKKYIGQTKRNDDSYLGSGKKMLAAIKKYGKENFKRETLCICNSHEELNEKERYFISVYDATNSKNFYNIRPGGDQSPLNGSRVSEVAVLTGQNKGTNNPRSKKYKFISSNGEIHVVVGGLKEFCNLNNLNGKDMIDLSKGRTMQYKGWATAKIDY